MTQKPRKGDFKASQRFPEEPAKTYFIRLRFLSQQSSMPFWVIPSPFSHRDVYVPSQEVMGFIDYDRVQHFC